MKGIVQIDILRFLMIYLLLFIILEVMRRSKIKQAKLLFIGSLQMSVQLVIAGFVLTYIFKNPHPIYTITYVLAMVGFAIHRVLSKNKNLNKQFKKYIAYAVSFSGIGVMIYFVVAIVNENIFNPQYVIPLSGMIFGNTMTGLNIGIKTFQETLISHKNQLDALLNFGGRPKDILKPIVSQSLETALLPTLNSMVGMGIISLPGMMTGQILSGTLPTTAIMYQICIMIAICTVVCLSVFLSLHFGHKTLYNSDEQFDIS